MKNYLSLLTDILDNGHTHGDRTGVGRRSIFSPQIRFDLSTGLFPVVTTRKINPMVGIIETLMFIRGETNTAQFHEHGVKIWDPWAVSPSSAQKYLETMQKLNACTDEQAAALITSLQSETEPLHGEIGPMYGSMWRHWPKTSDEIHRAEVRRTVADLPSDFLAKARVAYDNLVEKPESEEQWLLSLYYSSVDQLNELVCNLKQNPFSSRHLVTAFNPEFTPIDGVSPDVNVLMMKGSLMPCHFAFQCFVLPAETEGGKLRLSLKSHIRSSDGPVGLPHNIVGYAFLLSVLAHCTDMEPYELVMDLGDAHIYRDQIDLALEQIELEPMPLPTLWLNPEKTDLFSFTPDDVRVDNYVSHPAIKYPVAV